MKGKGRFVILSAVTLTIALLVRSGGASGEDCDKAKELFYKAIGLNTGQVCTETCLMEKAELYQEATELCPNYAQAHNNLGDVFENLGRYKEAIEHYRRATSLEPSGAIPYFGLGDVFFRNGSYERAIEWYEKGLELDPKDSTAQKNLRQAKILVDRKGEPIQPRS